MIAKKLEHLHQQKRPITLTNRLALLKQAERDSQANKKVSALAKEALSETATPQDIVNALVDKVLVCPDDRIEIRWKFVSFAEGI